MDAVFLKLLNLSLSASWLVAAVLLLRLLLKRAPKAIHCLLWAIVALRLVLPFSLESSFSLLPEKPAPAPESSVTQTTPEVLTGFEAVDQQINAFLAHRFQTSQTTPNPLPPVTDGGEVPVPAETGLSVMEIVTSVWILGMVVMISYSLVAYLRLRYRVRDSVPLQDNIRISDKIPSPFILGILRPRIYLPHSLSEGDRPFVLAHENAHLKRRDHWWKPLGFALLAVYWFNPVLWVAYVLLCRDIEFACDEKVLQSLGTEAKRPYSRALVNSSVPRGLISACPLAFGEVGVKHRIKSVLNYKKPAFWIILVALLSCAVLAVCFLTDPRTSDPDQSTEAPPVTDTNTDDTDDPVLAPASVPGGTTLMKRYWIPNYESVFTSEDGSAALEFRDAEKELSVEQVFQFFEFIIGSQMTMYRYYDDASDIYRISLQEISTVIEDYLGFDCTERLQQLPKYEDGSVIGRTPVYDEKQGVVLLRNLGQIDEKEQYPVVAQVVKNEATIGLVIDYYDEAYANCLVTKVYIITDDTSSDPEFRYEAVYSAENPLSSGEMYSYMSDESVISSLMLHAQRIFGLDAMVMRIEDTCSVGGKQRSAVSFYTSKGGAVNLERLETFESGDTRESVGCLLENVYYHQVGDFKETISFFAEDRWRTLLGHRFNTAEHGMTILPYSGTRKLLRNDDGSFTIAVSGPKSIYMAAAMVELEYMVEVQDIRNSCFFMDFDSQGNFVRYRVSCEALGDTEKDSEWLDGKTWGTCMSEISFVITDSAQVPDVMAPWIYTPEKKTLSVQEAKEIVKKNGASAAEYEALSSVPVPISEEESVYLIVSPNKPGATRMLYRVNAETGTVSSSIMLSSENAEKKVAKLFENRTERYSYETENFRLNSVSNVPYYYIRVRMLDEDFGFTIGFYGVNSLTGTVVDVSLDEVFGVEE